MNANNYNTAELSIEELRQTNGGFFFLLPIVGGLLVSGTEAALFWGPLAAAAVKGWNDAK